MKSVFEAMGGTYRQCGDFFIPEMALPDTPRNPIGKYGRMRHRYLKEHRGVLYNAMILDGTLWSHLAEVDKICKERMDVLILGMKEKWGITEDLKAHDPMAWVGAMNNIRSAAEEILFAEVIYA
ncbi:MAG: TnpV protein [Clostridiales bacterium]|nr:TnpV protein [Clostridiales bacterium]